MPKLTAQISKIAPKNKQKGSKIASINNVIINDATKLDLYFAENLSVLQKLESNLVDLIYIDPPFNTGRKQKRTQLLTVPDENGDRVGFQGKRYKTQELGTKSYPDSFDDFLAFIEPRLVEAHRILKDDGALFFHIDYRESHYCKVLLDKIFGRKSFMNEIIWAYDYGARSRKKWPAKHDNIFWYAKDPKKYTYNYDQMDRLPYLAPGLVSKEKALLGKTPTDVWWNSIVSTNGKEKTGYATQKPRAIIDRIVKVHSKPNDLLLDFFAGSGTFGHSALDLGRNCILIDKNSEAIEVIQKRLLPYSDKITLYKTDL